MFIVFLGASAIAAADAQDAPRPAATEPASRPVVAEDAAKLIAAIRNDDIIWEIEFPSERWRKFWWIGPHYSPRARRDTATYTLIPYPHPNVGKNRIDGDVKEKLPPPPFPFREVAKPLVDAMEDSDRWIAAHVVLTHLTMRGGLQLRKGLRWRWPWTVQGSAGWLMNLDDRKDLPKLPNGAYEDKVGGLCVELLPKDPARDFELDGTPAGEWTVRPCAATIDAAQREPLRKWWLDRLRLLAEADAAQPPATAPATRPARRD